MTGRLPSAALGCAAAFALLVRAGATAGTATAFLSGTVTLGARPASGATVIAAGNNVVVRTMADLQGRFVFASMALGTYEVAAAAHGLEARERVDVPSGGAVVTLALRPLHEIGRTTSALPLRTRGSGSDVVLNGSVLRRSPYAGSLPETLIQLPGAVRGANGVVHLNGDHGVIDYNVDGVPLPQALNRVIGSEIDPSDVAFLEAIQGAYPAQYGLRFGSVLNITTRSGTGPAGFDGEARFGSYTDLDQTLAYHAPLQGGGGYAAAMRNQQTTRGLDPPNSGSPHNDASDTNQFVRLTLPRGTSDFTDVTLIHSFRTYQIPNDVAHGQPAGTDDGERQEDTFATVQFRHAIGTSGAFSFGPAMKASRIRDFGDPPNDFAYGQTLNVAPPPFGNGGSPTDCRDALKKGAFSPTTCAFSLRDDKTALDGIFSADFLRRYGKHEVRAGVLGDATRVSKNYAVTLQPDNFLAPILTPHTPHAAVTVVDDQPNAGNTYGAYVQDSWRPTDSFELDYGLRYDFFRISSTNFASGYGAFSPRLKITRFFGQRASVYAYLGRFFEPFSLENVDPRAAHLLNLPLQPSPAQFDLRPERDTQVELGAHLPLGNGSLGLRVWQKNANDLIDDTQVGSTLLHQDINYALGRLSQEALSYEAPLARGGRAYVSLAHTVSLNAGCETQLLAPCFGAAHGFTPADHDQRYSAAAGVLRYDGRGGWFSGDLEYGSGLSSAACPPGTPGFCKMTPHTIVAVERGIGVGRSIALTVRIRNLFNDRYYVTLLNAQGNHYGPPRTIDIGVSMER